jgi:hypothetical protein
MIEIKEKKWNRLYTIVLIANLIYIILFFIITQMYN